MNTIVRGYLTSLTEEELEQLELEVLHATSDITKNNYLKEINEEKAYRIFRQEYYKAKKENHKKSRFINSNKINLLAIYKYHEQGVLTDYLEQFTKEQLKKIKSTLINKYHFTYDNPIIEEISINLRALDYTNSIKEEIKVVK